MGERERRQQAKADEAQRDIRRLNAESETLFGSSAWRMASHVRDHFGGADKDQSDRIEVWGTRIGRSLGLVFAAGLLIYMFVTYVK